MRTDALRNRRRIAEAAVELFTAQGPGVSMEEIAKAAGLGVGTLYRHFPDRQALLEEIAADSLRSLHAQAEDLAAGGGGGWRMLVAVLEISITLPLALTKSLSETSTRSAALDALVARNERLFTDLVRQAQAEGAMRADLTPEQVVDLLSVVICRTGAQPRDALSTVVLDGLKTR